MRAYRSEPVAVLIVVLSLAFAYTACNRPDAATAPRPPRLSAAATTSGVLQSASGSGSFAAFGPRPFGWRVFAFTALERADGTVNGQFEIGAPTTDLHTSGDVVCMSVVGNEAWVGAIVRRINVEDLAFIVGWAGIFHVVDNGEGAQAPADQITFFDIDPDPNTATTYCQDRPVWQPLSDIEAGNIQVGATHGVTGANNPFVGSWENTDPIDGSHQHMTVGEGPNMPVQFRDDAATACINAGFGFVPATIKGFAVITADDPPSFAFTGDVYCHPMGPGGPQLIIEDVTLTFTYDPERGILFTEAGVDCWYRSGNPERCA